MEPDDPEMAPGLRDMMEDGDTEPMPTHHAAAAKMIQALGVMHDDVAEEDPEAMDRAEAWLAEVNPPSWVLDEATWQAAKEAVDPEGEGSAFATPYAVVTHVYKQMGGRIG